MTHIFNTFSEPETFTTAQTLFHSHKWYIFKSIFRGTVQSEILLYLSFLFFAKRNSQRKLQPELYSLHRYLYITIAMINLSVVMCEHLNSPDITSSGYSSTDFWSSTHKWIRFRIGIGVYEQNVLPPTLLLQLQSSVIMMKRTYT